MPKTAGGNWETALPSPFLASSATIALCRLLVADNVQLDELDERKTRMRSFSTWTGSSGNWEKRKCFRRPKFTTIPVRSEFTAKKVSKRSSSSSKISKTRAKKFFEIKKNSGIILLTNFLTVPKPILKRLTTFRFLIRAFSCGKMTFRPRTR